MTGVLAAIASSGATRVTLTPSFAEGSGTTDTILTNTVSVSVNVAGSFTYVWSFVTGLTDAQKALPDGSVMRWQASLPPGADTLSTWKVEVYSGATLIGEASCSVFIQRF